LHYHTIFFFCRQEKRRRHKPPPKLLLPEGLAVGALIHCRILFVRANQNAVQGAVVFGIAVISALLNGAFDALVCLAVHRCFLLLFGFGFSMPAIQKKMHEFFSICCKWRAGVL
jgi:hypothetical protein